MSGTAVRKVGMILRSSWIVCLGSLDDYRSKLDKLTSFYRNGLAYEGWEACRYINLAYRGQVVCSD